MKTDVEIIENPVVYTDEALEAEQFKLRFHHLFWLFLFGCIAGVLIEGIYCVFSKGHWESHVTFLWGQLNIVYGLGAVAAYLITLCLKEKNLVVCFFAYVLTGSVVEYISGWVQDHILNSTSWEYDFMVIGKYVSIPYSIAWGALGLLFISFIMPLINKGFRLIDGRFWNISAVVLSVFVAVDLVVSAVVIYRWCNRNGSAPSNKLEELIDNHYTDEYMQLRFVEWVINEPDNN